MSSLTITELELTPGIWTPHAAILCLVCHKKLFGGKWGFGSDTDIEDERFEPVPLDDEMDSAIAICDQCGKHVWMDYKIAWEQKVVHALLAKGHKATMDQTGGMCSAASLYLDSDEDGGQKHILITESDDGDTPHNEPMFVVGYYHYENPYGDDAEGEDYEVLPFDEAVAYAVKIAKEGRHVEP